MNNRIKDLATKAIVENISSDRWVFNDAELEKFAQSIVQECAGVGYDASYYECALNISNKIKEHFGVEE